MLRESMGFYIDLGDTAVPTGSKGYRRISYDCRVLSWRLVADSSCSVTVDVLRSTFSAFPSTTSIVAADMPTLSSQSKAENAAVTTWADLNEGDMVEFVVLTNSGATRLGLYVVLEATEGTAWSTGGGWV